MGFYAEAMDLRLVMPTPVHAQTDAALAAVDSIKRDAWRRRIERIAADFVVDHGRPRVEPWPGDVVPRNARALIETAEARGWRVNLIERPDHCVVEGIRKLEGFRAIWVRGRASSGTWHEPLRYSLIQDMRPDPKVNTMTRTSIANRRPVGVSRIRLSIVASPIGLPLGVSAVVARVGAS